MLVLGEDIDKNNWENRGEVSISYDDKIRYNLRTFNCVFYLEYQNSIYLEKHLCKKYILFLTMTKIRTTITIDKELLNIAHNHKIRISTFLHNSLIEYLGKINGADGFRKAEAAGSNPAQSMGPNRRKSFRLLIF